jgi:hypothetical protein
VIGLFDSDHLLAGFFSFSDCLIALGSVLKRSSEDGIALLLHGFNSFFNYIISNLFKSFYLEMIITDLLLNNFILFFIEFIFINRVIEADLFQERKNHLFFDRFSS